jgi:hypothetical protein
MCSVAQNCMRHSEMKTVSLCLQPAAAVLHKTQRGLLKDSRVRVDETTLVARNRECSGV